MGLFGRFRRGREVETRPPVSISAEADPPQKLEKGEPGTLPANEQQAAWAMAWVRTFDAVLELYPRPDGGVWTGEGVERATADRVPAAYFEDLLHGRVYAPIEERLEAIAGVFGVQAELLGREVAWWESVRARHRRGVALAEAIRRADAERDAERVGRLARELFEGVSWATNRASGELLDEEDIAAINNEYARGPEEELRPEELRAIREGLVPNPTSRQLLGLCETFGVPYDYWEGQPDRLGQLDPLFDSILSGGSYAAMPGGEDLVDAEIEELSRREKVVLKPN